MLHFTRDDLPVLSLCSLPLSNLNTRKSVSVLTQMTPSNILMIVYIIRSFIGVVLSRLLLRFCTPPIYLSLQADRLGLLTTEARAELHEFHMNHLLALANSLHAGTGNGSVLLFRAKETCQLSPSITFVR